MKYFFLALFFALFVVDAQAATTYWASTSGGAGSCGAASGTSDPGTYRTFLQGVACLSSGDTLILKDGTYTTGLDTNSTTIASGSGDSTRTTIKAQNTLGAIFQTSNGSAFNLVLGGVTSSLGYLQIEGVSINATNSRNSSGGVAAGGGGAHDIRFLNVECHNAGGPTVSTGTCAYFNHGGSNIQWIGGSVHDNGTTVSFIPNDSSYGFYDEADATVISHVAIYNNGGYGIHGYTGHAEAHSNNVYSYNDVHDNCLTFGENGCAGILAHGGAVNGTNMKIYGNKVYNNRQNGIGTVANGSLVYNNTVYNNPHSNIGWSPPKTAEIKNNIVYHQGISMVLGDFYDNGGGSSSITFGGNLCTTGGTTGCGRTTGTLPFVSTSNFHLATGSAAISSGVDVSTNQGCVANATCLDYDGVVRPQGGAWDAGALEFVTVGAAPVVTITSPTSSASYSTSTASVAFAGTATNTPTSINWTCDRCTTQSGSITPGASWSLASGNITFLSGVNLITICATNASGTGCAPTLTVTYSPTFPGNALVWASAFETGSGTSALDSSGGGHNGTLVNGASWTTLGRRGGGITLDGIDDYIEILDTNPLDLTQSFTLSAWVQPSSVLSGFTSVISKQTNMAPNHPYELFASITGYCADGGVSGFLTTNGASGPTYNACSAVPLPINIPTHLALTYDGANLKLYKNGVLLTTTPASGYMEPSTGSLIIGASEFGEYLAAMVDDVRVYNFAIPISSTNNSTPGAACNAEEYTVATASIIGDMNCSVIPAALSPPLQLRIGAASSLRIGADATVRLGQ